MDWQTITSLISGLGFPIVACIALFSEMRKRDERHSEEVDSLRKSLDDNTVVITRLYEVLEGLARNGGNE